MRASSYRRLLTPPVRVGLSVATIVVTLALLPELRPLGRALVAFNVGAITFLILLAISMAGAAPEEMRHHLRRLHRGGWRLVSVALLACLTGLSAVAVVLHSANGRRGEYRVELLLSTATIFCAWMLLQSTFATFYARYYYQPMLSPSTRDDDQRGLAFQGDGPPDYWDFVYFSFTIGTCYSTSDTQITSRALRRAATLQMLVSFLFYTFFVGMLINAIGALLGP